MSELPEETEAAEHAAEVTHAAKLIAPKVLSALLREHSQNKTKVGEINGSLAERIKHHKEHSNLNIKAFRIIAMMHRMESFDRDTFWDDLRALHDIAHDELWKDHGHVGDLARMAEEERDAEAAAEMAEMEARVAANTKAIEKGISELEPPAAEAPKRRSTRPSLTGGDAAGTYKLN